MTAKPTTPSELLERFDALDARLVAAGFPATSAWWQRKIRRFYKSGRRQLVLRVGRRGGKSSTLCRIGVLEALYGGHVIPPGDVGVVAIVSVSRDEAYQRLRTVRAILDALRVKHRPIDGGLELVGRPIAFKTYAASISGVSGFTSIAVICDEVSKWRDADTGANPAKEVLGSIRPTMATMRSARIFLSSSPLGNEDAHAVAFDAGDTSFQQVAYAPTWIANPSITEEETHDLEPDLRIWSREYPAIPQASVLAALDFDLVNNCFGRTDDIALVGDPVMIVDPSSGRGDAWTWGIARWCRTTGDRDVLIFELVAGIAGKFSKTITGEAVVSRLAGVCREYGVTQAHGDQRESFMLRSAFARHDIAYRVHDWTAPKKQTAVERLRRWLSDSALILPPHDRMKREMHAFEEKIAPTSGGLTYGARNGKHDDYVALLLTAGMVDLVRGMRAPKPSTDPRESAKTVLVTHFDQWSHQVTEHMLDGSTRTYPYTPRSSLD